jgi:hypothetical protein
MREESVRVGIGQPRIAAVDPMQMNVRDERCLGAELFTADGRCILRGSGAPTRH